MTFQEDSLIVDGMDVILLYCDELLSYRDPRVNAVLLKEDSVSDKGYRSGFFSRLPERCYTAHWEIRDKTLLLTKIEGCFALIRTAPIVADWYSGFVETKSRDQLDEFDPKIRTFRLIDGCVQKIKDGHLSDERPAWTKVPGFNTYIDEGDLLGDSDSLTFQALCKGIDRLISETDSVQTATLLRETQEALKVTEGFFRNGSIAKAREKLILDEALFVVAYKSYSDRLEELRRIDVERRRSDPYGRNRVVDPMTCIGCGTTIPKKEYGRYGGDCIVCHFKKAYP